MQIENPRGAVVLLRLTLKRRKLPHYAFDPASKTPKYPKGVVAVLVRVIAERVRVAAGF